MKEIELKNLRGKKEKHFLRENGEILAQVFNDNIHYLKDNKYIEIDNTLVKENNYYTNKDNDYHVYFDTDNDYLLRINKDNYYINIKLDQNNISNVIKDKENIYYYNILKNIDIKYNIISNKVKEDIILKDKEFENINYIIETNLDLLLENKKIYLNKDNKTIFIMNTPFMYDSNNIINNNINYELNKLSNNLYTLNLVLDTDWLNDNDRLYPVIIDPTITEYDDENSCYDTYIYSGDTNVDRNSTDILKAGVEKINGVNRINRTLIKFHLPKIGTGSQITNAELSLYGYPIEGNKTDSDIISIHRITEDWNETTANWNTMNNKFDSRVEGAFRSKRSSLDTSTGNIEPNICSENITSLVKKWYEDTPNYGIMLKMSTEEYNTDVVPAFFSKNNTVTGYNPKPILAITYRNQNGLESYMDYKTQSFSKGSANINAYNGNLTTVFNLGATIGGKLTTALNMVYNTNDVVLENNIGYGVGYRFNFNQTIEEETIDSKKYLSYIDEDGTIHYFYNDENIYKDEDGLDLTITQTENEYTLSDKHGNKMIFIIDKTSDKKVGYLKQIIDLSENKVEIEYDNNHKITKVIDANEQEINITYDENKTSIISPDQTVYLNYINNKPTSIETITGTTTFLYNTNNTINKIIDETGLSIVYEYYDQIPYRVKKISEYGLNDELGTYFDIKYNFNSTTFTDNKNRVSTLTFNNYGNTVTITSLDSEEDISNAYGMNTEYGDVITTDDNIDYRYKNKVISSELPYKCIKNYLTPTFFTEGIGDRNNPYSVNAEISSDYAEVGLTSLKLSSDTSGLHERLIDVPKGDYYTFSTYVKNDCNLRLILHYFNNLTEIREKVSELITPSEEFKKHDVTIYLPEDATSTIYITIEFVNAGTAYFDCLQLETGDAANNFNLIENSDFYNGIIDWTLHAKKLSNNEEVDTTEKFEITTFENGNTALKVNMKPEIQTSFSKNFNITGKLGESYNISFWYKNKGLQVNNTENRINNVLLNFNYTDDTTSNNESPIKLFNPNENEWQFYQTSFIAQKDYNSFTLTFTQSFDANEFYITNLSLTRSPGKLSYNYDKNGNIIESSGLNNETDYYNYDKNNELIKMTDPLGKNFTFEYDNNSTDKLLGAISPGGISNEIKYDEFKNPKTTKIINYGKNEEIVTDFYRVRAKGTKNYIKNYKLGLLLGESECNHNLWQVERIENDLKIKHPVLNKYIKILGNILVLSNEHSLFTPIKNNNGSYLIKDKTSEKYIKANNLSLEVTDLIEDDHNFEFYFENTNSLFIESNASYTEDGRFITSTTDSVFNKTIYNIDPITGLTNSITNPKNQTTSYEYNNKRELIKVTNDDKSVNYQYNDNGTLKSITEGNRVYNFEYDNFLNVKQVKIGDTPLITNTFDENNGNLTYSQYGNEDNVWYTYDEHNRLKCISKVGGNYYFRYGSNGELLKVYCDYSWNSVIGEEIYKYEYDLAKRLREYRFNNFKTKYNYDKNDNIATKQHILNDITHNIENTYDNNDNIIKKVIDNNEVNYTYDYLGRITNRNINNSYNTDYTYITNGKRTSLLVKTLKNNNDIYKYKYDKLNNITHIYLNDNLINRYYYDNYNELIKEHDYQNNQTIEYTYDNYGNLLSKKIYELNTTTLVSENTYEYSNTNWVDQLTKFNNESITYDEIGNPLTIGNKTLSWIWGRSLYSYNDGTNNIVYKYNKDNIRTIKWINNTPTYYYLEGNDIVFEETNDNVIYYIRDISGLTGFKYNNNIYYYVKNLQNDIIGILDSNYQEIVKYKYDSWGNILSILDNNGNDISNDSTHIANINPYRYRSYYYDKETDLYYLNSRYYNPKWGRFLNADRVIGTNENILSYNVYSYCNNNPIVYFDVEGQTAASAILKFGQAILTGIIGGITSSIDGPLPIADIAFAAALTFATTCNRPQILEKEAIQTMPTKKGNHIHHIVAQKAAKAAPARTVLNRVGIKINNSANLVSLPATYHQHLHTNKYYFNVNMRIILAEQKPFDDKKNVEQELGKIRLELIAQAAIFPK